jgi:hypothetical protein
LRSPLNSISLDAEKKQMASRPLALVAALIPLFLIACSGQPEPGRTVANPARYRELRTLISLNLHFNPHCWCMAAEADTAAAVRSHVASPDISVLIDLLADHNRQVQIAARSVLVQLGPEALPALKSAVASRGPSSYEASEVIALIDTSSGHAEQPSSP